MQVVNHHTWYLTVRNDVMNKFLMHDTVLTKTNKERNTCLGVKLSHLFACENEIHSCENISVELIYLDVIKG